MWVLLLGITILVIVFVNRYLLQSKHTSVQTHPSTNKSNVEIKKEGLDGKCEDCTCTEEACTSEKKPDLKILYGTQTGTAKHWATVLAKEAHKRNMTATISDMGTYDPDELMEAPRTILFVVATYTDGTPPETCKSFFNYLEDQVNDFRVSRTHYQNMRYAIFGIGHSVYGKRFNAAAKNLDKMLQSLSAQQIVPVGLGDNGAGVEVDETFSKWNISLWEALSKSQTTSVPATTLIEEESDEEDKEPLMDMEDLGKMMKPKKKPTIKKPLQQPVEETEDEDEDEDEDDEEPLPNGEIREMLTPSLRKALTKQGYRLLGTHSGVKLCRWTKAMLRGRGGCYKHSFYGIASYQCMEMTPSLACANKCVFCWRHHKNPVGKEWKWKVDGPEELVEAAVKNHQQMIKQLKGVPGVVKERYDEAFTIRHCALSLVGEPIIYPYINEFVDLLHKRKISSFLVTNAQFPDKIDEMKPVTQLYISVDAATKESLKKIDRPLFADFWERFLACIDSLSKKGQRTVFRLTLVKDWNMEEVRNYAELILRGKPSFIEIKGVTYCGTSTASNLTIKNVPFHEEVIRFCNDILNAIPELREIYGLACEHEHSCCVLIAHKRFYVNNKWHTWIDYEKFHELSTSGQRFTDVDYMAESPSWSLVGSKERGFDPEETRFHRNKPPTSGC